MNGFLCTPSGAELSCKKNFWTSCSPAGLRGRPHHILDRILLYIPPPSCTNICRCVYFESVTVSFKGMYQVLHFLSFCTVNILHIAGYKRQFRKQDANLLWIFRVLTNPSFKLSKMFRLTKELGEVI